MQNTGEWLMWSAIAVGLYAYLGYPAAAALLATLFGRPHRFEDIEPTVTLIIPAHNEEKVIAAKIENSLSQDYPRDKLDIRVVSDGSDDTTDAIAREYESRGVTLQRVAVRGGKPNAVNLAVLDSDGEILVLCDANTMFAPDAVRKLVRHFADPDVGAVTGDVRLQSQSTGYGEGESLYYRLERLVQRSESRLWSVIGVDGGMYAVRREVYRPNHPDVLIDDFAVAMGVVRAGKRVIYDPEAVATEDAVVDPRQEFRRRSRTAAGGFQAAFGRLATPRARQLGTWLAYVSHKVLRWLSPFVLVLAMLGGLLAVLAGNAGSWRWRADVAVVGLQGSLYLLALVGLLYGKRRMPRLISLPFYFCLGNAAALAGFLKWMFGLQAVTWSHADRSQIAQ